MLVRSYDPEIDGLRITTIELLNVDELTELLREALMVLAPARVSEKVTGVRIEFGTSRGI